MIAETMDQLFFIFFDNLLKFFFKDLPIAIWQYISQLSFIELLPFLAVFIIPLLAKVLIRLLNTSMKG